MSSLDVRRWLGQAHKANHDSRFTIHAWCSEAEAVSCQPLSPLFLPSPLSVLYHQMPIIARVALLCCQRQCRTRPRTLGRAPGSHVVLVAKLVSCMFPCGASSQRERGATILVCVRRLECLTRFSNSSFFAEALADRWT